MASIAKAVEFNLAEIKECKENNKELGIEVKQLKKKNTAGNESCRVGEIQKKMEFKT